MMKKIEIIAELGINHNGDLDICRQMIDRLVEIGVDAIKFQIVSKELNYNLPEDSPLFSHFQKSDLGMQAYADMAQYCKKSGIKAYSSIADIMGIETFKKADFELVKLSSSNLTNRPLHEAIVSLSKPVIFSTGSGSLSEIINTTNFFKNNSVPVSVLHCISQYPAPFTELNLDVIPYLESVLNIPIGFSDHSEGSLAGALAIQHGAQILEKHFTLDHSMEGPDHKFSLNPKEMKEYVEAVRKAEVAIGNTYDYFDNNSLKNKTIKRTLVLTRDYSVGEKITKEDLIVARPNDPSSDYIHPFEYKSVIGRAVQKSVRKWDTLTWSSL